MWHRWLAALVLSAFGLAALAGPLMAAGDGQSAPAVAMTGQAAVVDTRTSQQLRLRIQSSGSPLWLLEVALDPAAIEPSTHSGYRVLDVSGSFTLGLAQQPASSGTVGGWMDGSGAGQIQLTDGGSATSLNLNFSYAVNGSVTGSLQGVWPAIPAAAPQPAQPAQPTQPTNHFFWYLSRVSAIAAYLLLFVSIFIGIGLKSRYLDRILERWRAFDLHQFTALVALGMIVLHIFSLLGDGYFHYTVTQLLVPGASPYRAGWTALGIVGFYALLIVVVSGYLRKRMGDRVWRAVHISSFVMFIAILAHSIKAGTDSGQIWSQWLYISTGGTLVFLGLWRWLAVGGRAASPANS